VDGPGHCVPILLLRDVMSVGYTVATLGASPLLRW